MSSTTVQVDGKTIALSNLDKILYPSGFVKAEVIDYYRRIGPYILPHLKDRPITLKRYPNGSQGMFFYQKRAPEHRPHWVRTERIATKSDAIDFCIIEDIAGLVWLANLACLEIHTYLFRADAPTTPTMMVFDLDPGAPAALMDCCRVALALQELLRSQGLDSLAKVSGSKGIHICVPLNTPVTFARTKEFAHAVARSMEQHYPQQVTSAMAKSERTGKVFIDWSQNDASKTTCCVFSLRALPAPMVSAPISWDQIRRAVKSQDASSLLIDAPGVLKRMARDSDDFAPLETMKQKLPPALPEAESGVSSSQSPIPSRKPAVRKASRRAPLRRRSRSG